MKISLLDAIALASELPVIALICWLTDWNPGLVTIFVMAIGTPILLVISDHFKKQALKNPL